MDADRAFREKLTSLCYERFDSLPKRGKPKGNEWTVLSCILTEFEGGLTVVALGTGSKCVGKSKMCGKGSVLNDSHAEVICRRSFLRFLYEEMILTTRGKNETVLSFGSETNRFGVRSGVRFHFFSSHVPCGDAAIFLKDNASEEFGSVVEQASFDVRKSESEVRDGRNSVEEPKVKRVKTVLSDDCFVGKYEGGGDVFRTGAKCLGQGFEKDSRLEGSGYHVLGVVRTKPGRGDPTLSVSCSDKLAKWCHLGAQGALLTLLLDKPIYFQTVTIAGQTPFNLEALERALYKRLGDEVRLNDPYKQNRVDFGQASQGFKHAKENGKQPCPSSISWCKVDDKSLEVAVEGKKQGVTKKKINTPIAQLQICKLRLFKKFTEVCETTNIKMADGSDLKSFCYGDVKKKAEDYQEAWNSLKNFFKVWTSKDESLIKFNVE